MTPTARGHHQLQVALMEPACHVNPHEGLDDTCRPRGDQSHGVIMTVLAF